MCKSNEIHCINQMKSQYNSIVPFFYTLGDQMLLQIETYNSLWPEATTFVKLQKLIIS